MFYDDLFLRNFSSWMQTPTSISKSSVAVLFVIKVCFEKRMFNTLKFHYSLAKPYIEKMKLLL